MLKNQFSEVNITEAGIDEAGRGCLAGPVFAAAVILPERYYNPRLNDSKQLTANQREQLRQEIENDALAWQVASVSNTEIDKINILKATFRAMHLAIEKLTIIPELLLIDGNRFSAYPNIPHRCIVKGDGIYMSIAAASILAKTHRDEFMMQLHNEFPGYGWAKNKGYPTIEHRIAIAQLGMTPWHRHSFKLKEQLKLDL